MWVSYKYLIQISAGVRGAMKLVLHLCTAMVLIWTITTIARRFGLVYHQKYKACHTLKYLWWFPGPARPALSDQTTSTNGHLPAMCAIGFIHLEF